MNIVYAVERRGDFQYLVRFTWKRTWKWFGVKREVIERERIPDHVIISLGCFGDTGGWMSRFKDYM